MKKLVAATAAVAGAAWLIVRARSAKADKDLWAEATDPV